MQALELMEVSLDGVALPWDGEAFKLTENGDLIIPADKVPDAKSFTITTKVGEDSTRYWQQMDLCLVVLIT